MDFPRWAYKRGTAKPVPGGGVGELSAESRLVRSEEEFKTLGPEWVGTPTEAAAEPAAPVAIDDREAKPTPKPKKVK